MASFTIICLFLGVAFSIISDARKSMHLERSSDESDPFRTPPLGGRQYSGGTLSLADTNQNEMFFGLPPNDIPETPSQEAQRLYSAQFEEQVLPLIPTHLLPSTFDVQFTVQTMVQGMVILMKTLLIVLSQAQRILCFLDRQTMEVPAILYRFLSSEITSPLLYAPILKSPLIILQEVIMRIQQSENCCNIVYFFKFYMSLILSI